MTSPTLLLDGIPVIDRLTITSIVDGTYLAVLSSRRLGTVSVERTSRPRSPSPAAEHGLAYHLASERGDVRRQILLDFGLTGQSLLANMRLLGIEAAEADALVLSHGHGDHYGGLLALAETTPRWAERSVPLYAGGEDTFCRRWTVGSDGRPLRSEQLECAEVEARGLRVVFAAQATVVGDHLLLSGQIPRVTDFEIGLPNARLEVGLPGTACGDAVRLDGTSPEAAPGELVPDTFRGEIAAIYVVRDRGLVVISSCGHAGIINTVRHAQQITGLEHVHAVVGGWHLADAADDVVARTVAAFGELAPDTFVPMHCTGVLTMARLEHKLPGRLIEPSVGTRVTFGA